MRAEETTRTDRGEENAFFMDCCYPGKRSEMMAHCGDDMKGKCGAAMEEMMRGDFNPTKEK